MRAEKQKTQASGTQMCEHVLERNVHIFYTKTCWGWVGLKWFVNNSNECE